MTASSEGEALSTTCESVSQKTEMPTRHSDEQKRAYQLFWGKRRSSGKPTKWASWHKSKEFKDFLVIFVSPAPQKILSPEYVLKKYFLTGALGDSVSLASHSWFQLKSQSQGGEVELLVRLTC